MSVLDHCRQDPITAVPEETVREVAKRMAEYGVGSLAVVDEHGRPIGMVTDRDIVQNVIRRRRSPDDVAVAEMMSLDVVSVWQEVPLVRAFHRMRQEAVRRVLVTDDEGKVVGILTFDDALPQIARALGMAAEVVGAQEPGPDARAHPAGTEGSG